MLFCVSHCICIVSWRTTFVSLTPSLNGTFVHLSKWALAFVGHCHCVSPSVCDRASGGGREIWVRLAPPPPLPHQLLCTVTGSMRMLSGALKHSPLGRPLFEGILAKKHIHWASFLATTLSTDSSTLLSQKFWRSHREVMLSQCNTFLG